MSVDPVSAAQQTIVLTDQRWEPPDNPAVSYSEMRRTLAEIEAMDRTTDRGREKAQRYLGWMQGVAESTYGVPAETLREVNRHPGRSAPWPGYEVDAFGWYSRPLRDGEARNSRFAFGFTDGEQLHVASPAQDPGRRPPKRHVPGSYLLLDLETSWHRFDGGKAFRLGGSFEVVRPKGHPLRDELRARRGDPARDR